MSRSCSVEQAKKKEAPSGVQQKQIKDDENMPESKL
jgi:hypothetical protein